MLTNAGAPGYLISFHTYGTWLPGDARGTVPRDWNAPGSPRQGSCASLHQRSLDSLRHAPVELDLRERRIVLASFEQTCRYRTWRLHAAHVRTNHVHVVVSAGSPPSKVMGDLKAWATRRLAEAGARNQGDRIWVRHGSTRYLWNGSTIADACEYVLLHQGEKLEGTFAPAP